MDEQNIATVYEIKYVIKNERTDTRERITFVSGFNFDGSRWILHVRKAIEGIESGQWAFFIDEGGSVLKVVVAQGLGGKYLRTEADADVPQRLLELPECPA